MAGSPPPLFASLLPPLLPAPLPSPLPSHSSVPASPSVLAVGSSVSSGSSGSFSHCPLSSGFSPFVQPSFACAAAPAVPLGPPQPPAPRHPQLLRSASTAFSSPVLPLTPIRRAATAAQSSLPLSASRSPTAARSASAAAPASATASATAGKSGNDKENQPPPAPAAAASGTPSWSAGEEEDLDMYSRVKRRSVLHLLVNGAVSGGRAEGGHGHQQPAAATAAASSALSSSASHSDEKAVNGKEEKRPEQEDDEAADAKAEHANAEQQTVRTRGRRKRVKEEKEAEPQQREQDAEQQQLSDAKPSRPTPRASKRRKKEPKRKRAGRRSESPAPTAARQRAKTPSAAARSRWRPSKAAAQAKKTRQPRKRAAASVSASDPVFAFASSSLPLFSPVLQSAGAAAAQSSSGLSPFSSGFESELQGDPAPSLRCYFLCSPASLVARVRFVLRRDDCQQNALARCIDVSPGTLSPLLNGKWTAAKRQTLTKLAVWAARRDVQLTLTVMERCRAWRCDEQQLALDCALEKEELRRWLRFDSTLEHRTAVDRAVCGFVQRSHLAPHISRAQPHPCSAATLADGFALPPSAVSVLSLFESDYVAAIQAGEMKNENGFLPIPSDAAQAAHEDGDGGFNLTTEADVPADDGLQALSAQSLLQLGSDGEYIDFQLLFRLNGKTDLSAASQSEAADAEDEKSAASCSEAEEEKREKETMSVRSPQSVPAAARGGGERQLDPLSLMSAVSSSSHARLHRPSLRFSSASSPSTATSASVSFAWSSSSPSQSGAAVDGGIGSINSSFFILDSASKRASPAAAALAADSVFASTAGFPRSLQAPLFVASSSPSASSAFTTAFLSPHRGAVEAAEHAEPPFTPSLFFLPANLTADSSSASTPRAPSSSFRAPVQPHATATPGTEPPSPISCLGSSQSLSSPPASRSSLSLSSLEVSVSGRGEEAGPPLARALDLDGREATDKGAAQPATAAVSCDAGEMRCEDSDSAAAESLSANDWVQVMRSLATRLPTQRQH